MRILVIEDEKKTAAFLAKGLREAGFAVDLAQDGQTGLELARTTKFDLLIVDIMLPTKDGWPGVAELRRGGVRTSILFLTPSPARALRADKLSIPQTSPVKPLIGKV
jgi:two-component system, OmpR family, copper resistance phosphate regulon response regulator CusR